MTTKIKYKIEKIKNDAIQVINNKFYIMCHSMFPKDKWVVKCPYKWLEQNNKERVRDGERPKFIEEFSWVESQANSNELLKEYIGETLYQEAIESELINE